MVKQPKTEAGGASSGPEKVRSDSRQARLEAALRENLKRRKQQSRARSGAGQDANGGAKPVEPDPASGDES